MSAPDPVLCEVTDSGVAVLTLNAPERINALPAEELLPRAIAYAEDIAANCAPSSLAVIKQQVYADTMRDVFEASAVAEKLMQESMLRPDFIEGITSFFEKRPPNFPPLERSTKRD